MAKLKSKFQSNLLTQSLKGYLVFSGILLLLFTPVIYFLFQKLYLDDVDEGLILEKKEFNRYTLPNFKVQDIEKWNRFNRDFKIVETLENIKNDTILQQFFYDTLAVAHEHEPYRVLYSPVVIENQPFTIFIRQNLIEEKDWIEKIAILFITLLVFITLGTTLINQWLNKKIWQSFYRNLKLIESFEVENANSPPKFYNSKINEFTRLTTVLNELIERVIKSYKAQREFAENAAHELQTPVAVLKSKIDTFLQVPELTNQQMQLLEQLNDATARLSRLNKNLLLLSRLEQQIFEKFDVDFKKIVSSNFDFWQEQCDAKQIKFNPSKLSDSRHLANLSLIEIMTNNLIVNAIRHNVVGGSIAIFLNQTVFEIKNSGNTESIHPNQLFQRFAKTDSSTQGNGLGLAIVKKIADLHSWQIEYLYEDGFHIFRIKF